MLLQSIHIYIYIEITVFELQCLNNLLINVSTMQARIAKKGFTNTLSGNLNARPLQPAKKMLDLDDFDVQMLSPDFLCSKTLKKPMTQLDINLKKTNPNGTRFEPPSRDERSQRSSSRIEINSDQYIRDNKDPESGGSQMGYRMVSAQSLNIKPAYKPKQQIQPLLFSQSTQLQFKDKNSIISALFKKGELKRSQLMEIKISKVQPSNNTMANTNAKSAQPAIKKAGPAEQKLKTLFNSSSSNTNINTNNNKKDNNTLSIASAQKKPNKQIAEQIDEELQEQIQEDYGNQSFQKMSGAYQSQIKQSIRQSMGGSSGKIKQSIRESIRESLRESIKDQIPEGSFRSGYSKSKQEVKQQINQSLNKQKQSIQQQVYEQVFEEASLSDEHSKSKSTNNFKKIKQKQDDRFQLSGSISASKKFRTKTNLIAKSIKFAQQLTIHNQVKNTEGRIQQKYERGDKLAEQIIKQKGYLQKLQQKISRIMNPHTIKISKVDQNKNKDLLYKFRIEVNRLITSENFTSKIRKLTAFLGNNSNNDSNGKVGFDQIAKLQDKLLGNLMERIQDLQVSGVTQQQLNNTKKQYDEKLAMLLKEQEMTLRVQMDRKLHEKDLELKKMIAELQQKMRTTAPISIIGHEPKKSYGDRVEVDSDYSIDSDDVSWKMDLWEMLPDFEKKKLYERQGAEVARFLTDALMKEIQNESLDRSADISFQFPEEYNNNSGTYTSESNKSSKAQKSASFQSMRGPTINREQLRKQLNNSNLSNGSNASKSQLFPPLPGVKKTAQLNAHDHFESDIHYLNASLGKIDQNQARDTISTTQVIKILSKYKNLMVKRKNDLIRKLVKTLQSKTKSDEPLSSLINQIRILNDKEIAEADQCFVKAYEQDIIMELVSIYNRNKNRKSSTIEQQMKKMYERLVVTCQVKTAQASIGSLNEIIPHETYVDLRMAQEDRKVKDALVEQICNILAAEFAKQMPKRKK